MLAGTYSVAVVPVLQGAASEEPKAFSPIAEMDVGRVILDKLWQYWKVPYPIVRTPVGMSTLERLKHILKAQSPIAVTLLWSMIFDKL